MFDYAMFTRLVEERVNENATAKLYICEARYSKEKFIKSLSNKGVDYKDRTKYLIFTINDIWNRDALRGTSYNEYIYIR